jgi:hypothetical protein
MFIEKRQQLRAELHTPYGGEKSLESLVKENGKEKSVMTEAKGRHFQIERIPQVLAGAENLRLEAGALDPTQTLLH